MALNLKKGQGLQLLKEDGSKLKSIAIAIGWQENKFDTGAKFDPDVTLFCCTDKEKDGWPQVLSEAWIICYAQTNSPGDLIVHSGDDRVGGDGVSDNETICIPDLTKLPPEITSLNAVISIYDAKKRKQNFGMMNKVYARILDLEDNGKEAVRFELNEGDCAISTGVLAVKVYKDSKGNWTFKAIQEGFENGLSDFVRSYGGEVANDENTAA